MTILAIGIGLSAFAFLAWWLLVETEGVYLGRRVVIALYDLYAARYDRVKQFDERADLALISEPIMERIYPLSNPLTLDVATGTGRVPLLLARMGRFQGRVVGVDASRRMLDVARQKIAAEQFEDFITLMRRDAQALPFAPASFDVVTCLEALEFMPKPQSALGEMVRVLRPGGLLLTTIRIDTRWMPNRTWDEGKMRKGAGNDGHAGRFGRHLAGRLQSGLGLEGGREQASHRRRPEPHPGNRALSRHYLSVPSLLESETV